MVKHIFLVVLVFLYSNLAKAQNVEGAVGYKDTLIALPPIHDTDTVLDDIRLDEVVVTAKPYVLRRGTDRIIMTLTGKNDLIKNTTILGVLRYTPLLKVDEVQGVSMIGKKNLMVYINGRKTAMTAAEVQNYLNSVPADNIKNIELITNPGSKFDVSAQTGILNINLKRNEHEGWKGFASAQMWQTHYNKQIASLNLNYAKGIFSMRTALTARNLADWSESESQIRFSSSDLAAVRYSMSSNRRQLYQGNVDLSFVPDKKHTLGAVFDFSWWDGNPTTHSASHYTEASMGDTEFIYRNQAKSNTQTGRLAANLNYAVNFDSKNSLSVDVDYQYYKMNQKERFISCVEFMDNASNGYLQKIPQDNNLWMGLVEYTAKLSKTQKLILGSGLYSSASKNQNIYQELQNLPSRFYADSRFDYKERNVSGYVSHESRWGDKLSTLIGLRYEYTVTKGDLKGSPEDVSERNHSQWLPSLSVTYMPAQQVYLWYSLASQSTYPMYEYLNPFKKYQAAMTYSTGNPNLAPSSTYYQEVGCYVNNRYMFLLTHYVTTDATDIFTQKENTSVEATYPINYGKESGVSLSMNFNCPLWRDKWLLNATLMGKYTHYTSSNYPYLHIDEGHFYGELNIDNTLILSKRYAWKLLCNYQFRTADRGLITKTESDMRGSIEVRKNIKDWSLAASYYCSWNYNEGKYGHTKKSSYITFDIERHNLSVGEYQGFMLKVSYNWGNKKVKSGKRHQSIIGKQRARYGGNK